MRCTAVPHTGHGCLYFPWTAKSSRNAVTFSGNFSRASCRSRSVHSVSTVRVASKSARTSSLDIFCVSRAGDSFARWRISSEYALPNHEEQSTLEDEDDPLAEPANLEHAPSAGCAERRVERAHHERTRDANPLQRLTGHARRDRLDVDGDVRKLRHAAVLTHLCSARS